MAILLPESLDLLDEVARQKPERLLEVAHVHVVGDQQVLDVCSTVQTTEKEQFLHTVRSRTSQAVN